MFGKTATAESTSVSNKDKSSSSNKKNTSLPPNISVSLPTLDYNIVEDMKYTHTNISLYEFTNIMGQWDILLSTLSQTQQ